MTADQEEVFFDWIGLMFSKVVVTVIEFTEVEISCIQMFFTGFVLCQFEIIQTETRSQTLLRKPHRKVDCNLDHLSIYESSAMEIRLRVTRGTDRANCTFHPSISTLDP